MKFGERLMITFSEMEYQNTYTIHRQVQSVSNSSDAILHPRGAGRGRGRGLKIETVELETLNRKRTDFELKGINIFEPGDGGNVGAGKDDKSVNELRELVIPPIKDVIKTEDIRNRNYDIFGQSDITEESAPEERNETSGKYEDSTDSKTVVNRRSGGKFWIDNKNFAIPDKSDQVLEEHDVEFYTGEPLSIHDLSMYESRVGPVLPTRIYEGSDGRYYTVTPGPVVLPLKAQIDTRLLYIDSDDVLYMRYHKEEEEFQQQTQQKQRIQRDKIGTFQQLIKRMGAFYSKFSNWALHCVGQDLWFPNIGEVVVVKVLRLLGTDLSKTGYFNRIEWQRAVVIGIRNDGMTVKLLDDYGVGGVNFENVCRITKRFAALPAQMFCCELQGMGIVNFRKMVQTIVRECPITNIWPDCDMVYVGTIWHGEFSAEERPLVEVMIQLKVSPLRYISLKTHVYQNLQSILTPFAHLVKTRPACHVLDIDETGFLWVKFKEDVELYNRIRIVLDSLGPYYYNLLDYVHLSVDMILPKDNAKRLKRNSRRLYAAMIARFEDTTTSKLYRVSVKKADPNTNKVEVYCVDDHFYHELNSWELVPLSNLYPDLSYIPPLVIRVHLYPLKHLDKASQMVKDVLYGEEITLALVHEWPRNVYPPEVFIGGKNVLLEESVVVKDLDKVTVIHGHAKHFVTRGCAIAICPEEMKVLSDLINLRVTELEKAERDNSKPIYAEYRDKKRDEFLASQTFMGDRYRFIWHNKDTNANSAVSASNSKRAEAEEILDLNE